MAKRAVVDSNQVEGAAKKQAKRAERRQAEREEKRRAEREERKGAGQPRPKPWVAIAGIAGALLLFLFIYLVRFDQVVGLQLDDAWYVLLAKALATGQGYTLINSPSPGILPLYPPGFPLLLSLAFRLSPQFPQNLWLLKSVSILAMLGAGGVAYYYFVRNRALPAYIAFGIAVATALNPGLVFVATSTVMSECAFTLALLLTVVVIERCVQAKESRSAWLYALLGAALASFAFLTRSMALGLVAAAFIYLLKERRLRAALIYAAGVALIAGSWMLYSRQHYPTPEQKAEQNSYIVRPYNEQFWDRVAGHREAGSVVVGDLPARFWNSALEIIGEDVGGMTVTPLFQALNQGLAERMDAGRWLLSLILSVLVMAGFISALRERMTVVEIAVPFSLVITVAWPFPPYRFILPFLPFVIFYLLRGVLVLYRLYQRSRQALSPPAPWAILGVVAWSIAVLNVFGNLNYISRKLEDSPAGRPKWIRIFEENEAVLKWAAENLPTGDAVVTENPPLVYLYTGHKTTTFDDPAGNWENWSRLGVRYLVHTSPVRIPDPDAAESKYRIIYRPRGSLNLRVVDLGPKEIRLPWQGAAPSSPAK